MSRFEIIKSTTVSRKSFRVASVIDRFDLDSTSVSERFTGEISADFDWNIGCIVGASGTGKSTIASHLYDISDFQYSHDSVIDDLPKNKSIEEICKTFTSVGFGSVPSWIKPYRVLSNGEKMRVDLANALLSDSEIIVFDEFTSVVDRHIAQIGAHCTQKTVRKNNRQFIAVTCHRDVLCWLLPDWVFDTDDMTFSKCHKKKDQKSSLKYIDADEKHGNCLKSITI